ncbi:DUF6850 family outer membrane beta-barrel protein [Faecalibacter rhinopitheci]|uniref:DUF6850 domain-containing protein n=1 Tax=Faecalibacter rhinopitheci TaxID=2779678 RepID=A0A8J7G460_9FLAO|nr:DUF6850 family outer membrane beta-barrel protein [Faecalibacter rhinopitheci]MBF0595925.1 hypothetical protein [Faecalibacter rhinopitheci]
MRSKLDLNSYDISLFARKNVNKVLILIMGSLASIANAQENDSIIIDSNPLHIQDIDQLNRLPISFSNRNVNDFTQTEVYFSHKKNEFSRKQTAAETNRYGFKSQGLFNVKNDIKIFGTIKLEKYLEKDLAFNLSDDRTDDAEVLNPHYYFVPRSSDWNNQQYHISGGAIKSFGGFNLAIKASLDANKLARQVDPRPEISNRKLYGEISAGYTLKNHQIFVLGGYGQKDKDYNYYYSNDQLDSPANPDTYIRFQSGFGRVINKPYSTKSNFSRKTFKHLGAGYQYTSANTVLGVDYAYEHDLENIYNEEFKSDSYLRFQYQTISYQGNLRLRHRINDKVLRANLSGYKTTSKNFDNISIGTNYMNRQRNVTFDINFSKQKDQLVKYYFGAIASYNQNRYMDQLAYVDQKINSLNVGIYGNKDIETNNKSKFNIGLSFNYYTAIKNELDYINIYGTTDNIFYNEVIRNDFAYNSLDKLDTRADIRYILPIKNNKNVVIYTQLRSIFALNKNRNNVVEINTNTTYQANFGIQLNY